jgi:hypothetical protein
VAELLARWKTESRFHSPVADEHMRARYMGEAYVPPVEKVVFYKGRGRGAMHVAFETTQNGQKEALVKFLRSETYRAFTGRVTCHVRSFKTPKAGKVEVRNDRWVELSVDGWPYLVTDKTTISAT